MKPIKLGIAVSIIAAITASVNLSAVPDTKIAIHCPDVVLWWPTSNGQSFLIQTRPNLSPETTWITLTNFYPATLNTNFTYFVHSNQVECSPGQTFGMMSAANGNAATAMSSKKPFQFSGSGPWVTRKDAPSMAVPFDIYPPGIDLLGRIIIWPDGSTDEWSKEVTEIYAQIKNAEQNDPQPAGAGIDSGTSMAFYRVINVTPKVGADVFGVEQDSFDNQLAVLLNDSDPNDDPCRISSTGSAQHGNIVRTPDGLLLQYSPDSSFYGIDSFVYTVTNFHGSSAEAMVVLFVNQSGNSRPTAGQTIITLETNNYTTALNVLTNAIDPDSDTITLHSVSNPRLGSISTNGTGNITYQRNPDWYGRDEFAFVVTDGRGGHAIGLVVIEQADSDGDEMPDEWEMRNGLDPFTDDSTTDGDGDGLPNLAEFKLLTNPHSSDNPLSISASSGGIISGFAQLPLPKLNPLIEKQPISLYVNGEEGAKTTLWQGPDGQWLFNWDTGFLTNGNYSLKAGFQYKHEVPLNQESTFFGQTNIVQVTNLVRFDELTSQFTDYLVIDASLAVQNASCRVDLYDEDGSSLVYGTFSITNGLIQAYWDLTDGNGNQLAFGSVKADFRIGPPGTTNFSSLEPIQHWYLKEGIANGSSFVVAWGWDAYSTAFNNRREQAMLNGVINLIDERIVGNGYPLRPAANVALATAFRFDTIEDKDVLIDELKSPNAGNFFWFGHSGKDFIAGNVKKSDISADDVSYQLGNNAHRSTPRAPRTNSHPYKLVILNGCENYSAAWANAFGIDFASDGSTATSLMYLATGRTPRAFVGWKKQIDVPNRFGSWIGYETEYSEGLAYLFYNWMQGNFLTYSLNQYANRMAYHGFDGHDSWRISGCTTLTRAD